ncbi:hypothetical protein ANANG_G00276980 [Anguilla anguilla]|uniref:AAA ATPase AAA+ lid domain-containing protein n=1 Tax=Anguilla anguilla TaxID=7936 RepID=A0A9D3LM42_ANGAN|nr:hypothetical protein ANANG_G00276980 [Anguilla anguilla]
MHRAEAPLFVLSELVTVTGGLEQRWSPKSWGPRRTSRPQAAEAEDHPHPQDRVLIVGTTHATSRNTFSSPVQALWSRSLEERGGQLSPELDLSSLAKVTDGYTQGRILRAVQAVLTQRRLDLQTQRPLRALEFIPPLARQDPVYKDEEETFKAWYSRTPLGKKRARAARASEEGEMGNGPEKGGKGKKKMMEGKAKGKKKKK